MDDIRPVKRIEKILTLAYKDESGMRSDVTSQNLH